MIPSILIKGKLDEQKRKRVIKEFKEVTSVQLNESDEFIFKMYGTHGDHIILLIQRLVEDQKALDNALSQYRAEAELFEKDFGGIFGTVNLVQEFVDARVLKISGESGAVDPHMKDTLDHFILFLKNKGMISRNAK